MKLKFSISYSTAWGETLHVKIKTIAADGFEQKADIVMNTADGQLWTLDTVIMSQEGTRRWRSAIYTVWKTTSETP